jgi:membrane-bound lytic murein transglycosylase MltF
MRIRVLLLLAAAFAIGARAAAAVTADPATPKLCEMVENAAAETDLPAAYLTRLLWTESGFNSGATSPVGAEGIAQFMPATAAERGLADPRDPAQAIAHAARFLVELDQRFGNLGLAAAAYNSGPGRVAGWLGDANRLPAETRAYVEAVTGHPVEAWTDHREQPPLASDGQSCLTLVAELKRAGGRSVAWERLAVSISSGGDILARGTGQPVSVADRLNIHRLLSRAVGLRGE